MSAYNITPADMAERLTAKELAQLTTDPPAALPDTAKIAAKIDAAEAEFHAAAGVLYAVPVVPSPDATQVESDALLLTIREKVLDLTAYKLMQLRPQNLNAGERAVYWSQLKKSIDTWLERLQSGSQQLPGAQPRSAGASSSAEAWAESDENAMSFKRLEGWR